VSSDLQLERRASRSYRVRLGGGLVLAALVPAVFGLAILASAAIGRPLIAHILTTSNRVAANRLTIVWGIALLAIAGGQLAGALTGLGSITSAPGFAARSGFALAAETILLVASFAYVRRTADTPDPRTP
jgi:hypothetical protein